MAPTLNWAKHGQFIRHKKSGRIVKYAEHANLGEGYMCLTIDKPWDSIIGRYEDFEPITSSEEAAAAELWNKR